MITTQNKQNTVLIKNLLEHPYTLKKGCQIATSSILTPEQAKCLKPINPAPLRHLLDTNHDDAIQYVNTICKMPKSEQSFETFWIPTPQECGYESQHTPNAANRPVRYKTESSNHSKDDN